MQNMGFSTSSGNPIIILHQSGISLEAFLMLFEIGTRFLITQIQKMINQIFFLKFLDSVRGAKKGTKKT